MTCATWREALSARIDGEDLPVAVEDLDAHLAGCAACAAYAADLERLHRSSRVREAEPVPDLTSQIIAADAAARGAAPVSATISAPAESPVSSSAAPGPVVLGSRRRRAPLVAAAAAAVVIVAVGAAVSWRATTSEPSGPAELRFASAYATVGPDGESASVYLSLTNDGGSDDLISVDTTVAERVSLHGSEERDGVVFMSHRTDYPVPADGTVTFQPGGAHVMVEGLDRPLVPGDSLPLTLRFAHATAVDVTATVVPMSDVVDLVGFAGSDGGD